MAYRWIVGCAVMLVLAAAVVPVNGGAVFIDPGTISLKLDSTQEPVASAAAGRRSLRRVRVPGFSSTMSSGDPALPCKTIYVALPPDADENNVGVSMRDVSVSEPAVAYDISPVPPVVSADGVKDWGVGKKIVDGRNQITYGSDSFYPSNNVRVVEVGRLRTWKVVQIQYWPCQYNPISGRLRSVKSGRIAVDYSTSKNPARAMYDPVAAEMAGFISNADQARVLYSTQSSVQPAVQPADYAIITTSAISSASTKLAAFVAFRESKGLRVRVVTETQWGGGTGDAAANRIRNWLKSNYLALGLRYVLLIGDPTPANGSVPMKLLWPRHNEPNYQDGPSDYFYADLTGNWDLDGDGYYGEYPDDFGAGGVDRIPEVYVGRIPVYAGNVTALDSILQKTMDYESGILGDWSRNFLLPMKALDSETPGYQLGETISNEIARPLAMSPWRVYDSAYGLTPAPECVPCSYSTVLDEWQNRGAGMVAWMTHGSATMASGVISSDMCAGLNDAHPSIVFCASCDNGCPENPSNLGYSLLKQGAVCTESASRASFYYSGDDAAFADSIGGMADAFAARVLGSEWTVGQAAYQSRVELPLTIWANHVVFNVYGDPALSFNSTGFGTVTGRVLDGSGWPIPGAIISTLDGKKQTTSASDGSYRVTGLGVTALDLVVTAPGFHQQRYYGLRVAPGAITTLDFHLEPTQCGSISGRVLDDSGRPLSGCSLFLAGINRSATSLADGTFTFTAIEPGIYSIYVSKYPYADQQIPECLVTEGQTSALTVTLRLCSGNVLANGNFEGGFSQSLAYLWQSYAGPSSYGTYMTGYDQHHDGVCSQKMSLPQPSIADSRIGIRQTAQVLEGQTYTLTAWERDYISAKETSPSDNVVCRIGYDPTGVIDAAGTGVIWIPFDAWHSVWNTVSAQATASDDALTVFLEARRKAASGGSSCYAWFDGVSLVGPIQPPQLPRVTVADRYISSGQIIWASWSVPVADNTLTYEYAVSRSPDGMGIITDWRSAGSATAAQISETSLQNGDQLYVLVRATDNSGATSEVGVSEPIRVVDDPADIPSAKRSTDGTWVRLAGVRVARMGDSGQCFVMSHDGLPGIEVEGVPWRVLVMKPGTTATAVGRLLTQGGRRVLADAEVMPSNLGPAPRPVGISGKLVGGGDYFYSAGPPVRGQKGSMWGSGVNNVGMLITVWGRVKSATSNGFIIDDGSLPNGLPVTCLGNAAPPAGNSYLRVVGIAGPYGMFVCDAGDITPL